MSFALVWKMLANVSALRLIFFLHVLNEKLLFDFGLCLYSFLLCSSVMWLLLTAGELFILLVFVSVTINLNAPAKTFCQLYMPSDQFSKKIYTSQIYQPDLTWAAHSADSDSVIASSCVTILWSELHFNIATYQICFCNVNKE